MTATIPAMRVFRNRLVEVGQRVRARASANAMGGSQEDMARFAAVCKYEDNFRAAVFGACQWVEPYAGILRDTLDDEAAWQFAISDNTPSRPVVCAEQSKAAVAGQALADELLAIRARYRSAGEYAAADEIRDVLTAAGWKVEDGKGVSVASP